MREMINRGAQVAFVARRREGVERVTREHVGVHGIVGDVSKKDDIHPIAMQIVGLLGGLDVLINNASDLGPAPLALLADTECEDLERALATNVLGPFRLTKALLGALASSAREGRGAVVLNVSSDAAINPYPRWGAYGASKAALHHLSRIWNEELTSSGYSRSCRSTRAIWIRRCTRLLFPTPIRPNSSSRRPRHANLPTQSASCLRS